VGASEPAREHRRSGKTNRAAEQRHRAVSARLCIRVHFCCICGSRMVRSGSSHCCMTCGSTATAAEAQQKVCQLTKLLLLLLPPLLLLIIAPSAPPAWSSRSSRNPNPKLPRSSYLGSLPLHLSDMATIRPSGNAIPVARTFRGTDLRHLHHHNDHPNGSLSMSDGSVTISVDE